MNSIRFQTAGDPGSGQQQPTNKGNQQGAPGGDDSKDAPAKPKKQR